MNCLPRFLPPLAAFVVALIVAAAPAWSQQPAVATTIATATAGKGAATCIPMRVGYIDQHRPPYWMGDGPEVQNPPGASVDTMHDAVLAAGFGCSPTWVRLPSARLRLALANGDIDMTPLSEAAAYPAGIVVPHDKSGKFDVQRAMHNTLVVLVRVSDKLPASTQPMTYFKGKVLGVAQGQTITPRLREAGLTIDDGARDLERNIEKLKLGRVDGVVVAAVAPEHLKNTLARYQGVIVALPQPLLSTRVWLAFHDSYYRAHRERVEVLWSWIAANSDRLRYTLEKYRKAD